MKSAAARISVMARPRAACAPAFVVAVAVCSDRCGGDPLRRHQTPALSAPYPKP
ncbi:hypothetical protein [Dyella nitratireducens]|uniref:hypothetical protein n=1 Tax=Dyella nitratireducens TaxID=1849580 RepID=UPI00166C8958|nr:hypothetical protein [Dyella nitratireducens]